MALALQGHMSDIYLLENKSLFWSLLSPHEVWAWRFSSSGIRVHQLERGQKYLMISMLIFIRYKRYVNNAFIVSTSAGCLILHT